MHEATALQTSMSVSSVVISDGKMRLRNSLAVNFVALRDGGSAPPPRGDSSNRICVATSAVKTRNKNAAVAARYDCNLDMTASALSLFLFKLNKHSRDER